MYRFLECKPVVVEGEVLNSKARSWAATLLDERLPEHREAVGFLQVDLAKSMDENSKGAMKNVEKLLIVTCASSTQIFMTLWKPEQMCKVKNLLEIVLKRFGDHVSRRAIQSVHMMNHRDECTIRAWWMAGEFEEEQTCEKKPTKKEDLHLAIVKLQYSGAQGCARAETQLSTMTSKIGELEQQLAVLSSEREHSFEQRIKECEDLDEKEWLEADHAADIPDEMKEVRTALSKLKLDQECAQDRLNNCIAVVVNFKPGAVLYKVDFMSESQREMLIRDNLGSLKQSAKTYVGMYQDPNRQAEATDLQTTIENGVVKASYDLMQEGLLPNFEKDSRNKGGFVSRTMNVSKNLLDGQVSDTKEYKRKVDEVQPCIHMKCSTCNKKYEPRYYRVIETGMVYPISSLSSETAKPESIIVFCSIRCQQKWDETLMCPKCKSFDWKHEVGGKASYPCPLKLIDNLAQYEYCRRNLQNIPVCPIARTETRMVPIPLCTTCSSIMFPRTPNAPHLTLSFSYDDMPNSKQM